MVIHSNVSVVRLSVTEETLFQAKKDLVRERLNKYTRKAFRMLPKLDKPRILDIGCGSGIPTIEIARLSKGEIIGIDIHQPSLDRFTITQATSALACPQTPAQVDIPHENESTAGA